MVTGRQLILLIVGVITSLFLIAILKSGGRRLTDITVEDFGLYRTEYLPSLEGCKDIENLRNTEEPLERTPEKHSDVDSYKLIATMSSGLGANLWIYASVLGLARMTNREPFLCSVIDAEIQSLFPHLTLPVAPSFDCVLATPVLQSSVSIYEKNGFYYDIGLIHKIKDVESDVRICCFFQNLGYIMGLEKEIRREFTLSDFFQSLGQERLENLTKIRAQKLNAPSNRNSTSGQMLINGKPPIFITVQVGPGDTLKKNSGEPQPNATNFLRGMDYYRNKYGREVVFVVLSDWTHWCKMNLDGPDVYYGSDLGVANFQEEFSLAVASNHSLISAGTYGWWMGFLAGGDVVYFEDQAQGHQGDMWDSPGQRYPYKWIPL